jgi:hypothetical protein
MSGRRGSFDARNSSRRTAMVSRRSAITGSIAAIALSRSLSSARAGAHLDGAVGRVHRLRPDLLGALAKERGQIAAAPRVRAGGRGSSAANRTFESTLVASGVVRPGRLRGGIEEARDGLRGARRAFSAVALPSRPNTLSVTNFAAAAPITGAK